MKSNTQEKINWSGTILSIQPRTNVWRYRCDNRTHSHTGYNIFLDGNANGEARQFSVAISEKQQQAVGLRIGDEASGAAVQIYETIQ
jgi:N-acetylneuraminic acid mutarotase